MHSQDGTPKNSEHVDDGMSALQTMYERQQQELEQLRQQNARLMAEREEMERKQVRSRSQRKEQSPKTNQNPRIKPQREYMNQARHLSNSTTSSSDIEENGSDKKWLKAVGIAVASVVACVVIYETGLLIPLGLIGLASIGIIKAR